jgi:hypothetical protein
MAFQSEFIADSLGDYWRRFKEIDVFKGYWDGILELSSNISLAAEQVNRQKGLFTVPVEHRSRPVIFVFDDKTAAAAIPAGFTSAFVIRKDIVSIPTLASISDGSGNRLTEGISYEITSPGVIAFHTVPPRRLFAADVFSNRQSIFRNFGFPIEFKQPNGEVYLRRTQALWYALWNGAAIENIAIGMQALFGLPITNLGRVLSITTNFDGTTTIIVNGQEFILPDYLLPKVFVGQQITNFTRLSDGVEVFDLYNNPELFALVDIPKPKQYFTFIKQVLADVIIAEELETGEIYDFGLIFNFIDKIRPAYANCILAILLRLKDEMQLFVDSTDIQEKILLTKTVDINYMNYLIIPEFAVVNAIPGATLADQVDAVKDQIEFALDEEVIAFLENLNIIENTDLILTPTVGNGPMVSSGAGSPPPNPAAGFNPVNHFSLGSSFETLNGTTLSDYNAHLTDFPEFDLDLETIGFKESLEVKDLSTNAVLASV